MRCCGKQRTQGTKALIVRPSATDGKDYVTIQDYIVAGNLYLQSYREELLRKSVVLKPAEPRDKSCWVDVDPDALYVDLLSYDKIMLNDGGPEICLSLWPRWALYADRLLSGEIPSRDEAMRSKKQTANYTGPMFKPPDDVRE